MKTNISMASARDGLALLFSPALVLLRSASKAYPKGFFIGMILIMALSALISFTLLRANPTSKNLSDLKPSLRNSENIPQNASALMEVFTLQAELKTFLDEKKMDQGDSLRMEQIIQKIQQLNLKLKRP